MICRVLRKEGTYDQIADENLQHFGLETGSTGKDLLQNANEEMAQRRADEHPVQRHLGHARAEVVAVLADVVGDPRGEKLLQPGQHAGGEHLGAQRVRLQLTEVGLHRERVESQRHWFNREIYERGRVIEWSVVYREISRLCVSTGQSLADLVRQILGLGSDRVADRCADSLLLKLDGHGGGCVLQAQEYTRRKRVNRRVASARKSREDELESTKSSQIRARSD